MLFRSIDGIAAAHESFGAAVLMIRYLRGAFNEVDMDATAFAHRNAEVLVISAVFLAPDAPDSEEARHRATWEALSSHFGGMYGNFSPTTADWVLARMYPPATAARLQAAKRAYDPDNVLRNNHNVMP